MSLSLRRDICAAGFSMIVRPGYKALSTGQARLGSTGRCTGTPSAPAAGSSSAACQRGTAPPGQSATATLPERFRV